MPTLSSHDNVRVGARGVSRRVVLGAADSLLQQAGHGVVAMDLPIEDNSATFDTYADVVCAALDGCSDDLILVGHSYAGSVIPLVAARRAVRHLVYVCAYVPDIGRSLADQLSDEPELVNPACYQALKADAQSRMVWCDLRAGPGIDVRRLRRSHRASRDRAPSASVGFCVRASNFVDRIPAC